MDRQCEALDRILPPSGGDLGLIDASARHLPRIANAFSPLINLHLIQASAKARANCDRFSQARRRS